MAPKLLQFQVSPFRLEPLRRAPATETGSWESISSSPAYRGRQSLARRTPPQGMSFPSAHVAPSETPRVAHHGLQDRVLMPWPCCGGPVHPFASLPGGRSLCPPGSGHPGPTQLLIWAPHPVLPLPSPLLAAPLQQASLLRPADPSSGHSLQKGPPWPRSPVQTQVLPPTAVLSSRGQALLCPVHACLALPMWV